MTLTTKLLVIVPLLRSSLCFPNPSQFQRKSKSHQSGPIALQRRPFMHLVESSQILHIEKTRQERGNSASTAPVRP
ncbi:hypothetical protein EDD85DRAFT_818032 [Armillaria nabsnona]|nr:hypothetical protein EDD85DRAFT_818032 [Armillaria nabsnona]